MGRSSKGNRSHMESDMLSFPLLQNLPSLFLQTFSGINDNYILRGCGDNEVTYIKQLAQSRCSTMFLYFFFPYVCLPGKSLILQIDSTIFLPASSQDSSLIMKMEMLDYGWDSIPSWSLEQRTVISPKDTEPMVFKQLKFHQNQK